LELFVYVSVNTIFKNHYMLIGKYIFVIFPSLFAARNCRGTCSSTEILKGYMARESLRTPSLFGQLANCLWTATQKHDFMLLFTSR